MKCPKLMMDEMYEIGQFIAILNINNPESAL